ncbi:hypothetical protein [Solibacillus daqui]|uniref:hypothetical protein n=1 Tax=Solibacillus daqui TaxID=2912187 RepID=UPI00236686A5|nr:hypothetical protein [Solibacillus daqui]
MGIIFWGIGLYVVIFLAVKHGINYSEVGLYLKNKQQIAEPPEFSNEKIDKS